MANRLLTPQRMSELCQAVSPGFRIITDADGVVFPTIVLGPLSWAVRTVDTLLSDEDFTSAYPRRMLANLQRQQVATASNNLPKQTRGSTHGDYTQMANLLTTEKIVAEMRKLDDVVGGKAGYFIGEIQGELVVMRKIDGKSVRYSPDDLWLSLSEFSDRILRPLITAPRNAAASVLSEYSGITDQTMGVSPERVRGSTHGDYTQMASVIQTIKATMRRGDSWDKLNAAQAEALELIATKIGRIVCGDPNCHDHWADLRGYATLALERISHEKG